MLRKEKAIYKSLALLLQSLVDVQWLQICIRMCLKKLTNSEFHAVQFWEQTMVVVSYRQPVESRAADNAETVYKMAPLPENKFQILKKKI